MKKNLVRILALALVLILALGIIPLGAFAAVNVGVGNAYFEQAVPTIKDAPFHTEHIDDVSGSTVTIKTSDYDSYLILGGAGYDLQGIIDFSQEVDSIDSPYPLKSSITFNDKSEFYYAWLLYTPHQHALSRWYSDGTTHWRECLVCKDNFMFQNWCQDGDEDQVCNVCGGHVPYHDITIIDSEGGKITVNRDNASHRMKITADVDVADGYTLHKLHFTKVRPDGSKQEVVRYEKGGQFWTNMPTYPMEVTAEFIKK